MLRPPSPVLRSLALPSHLQPSHLQPSLALPSLALPSLLPPSLCRKLRPSPRPSLRRNPSLRWPRRNRLPQPIPQPIPQLSRQIRTRRRKSGSADGVTDDRALISR
jgi:hypothetical protein